jgi:hypothetical protein
VADREWSTAATATVSEDVSDSTPLDAGDAMADADDERPAANVKRRLVAEAAAAPVATTPESRTESVFELFEVHGRSDLTPAFVRKALGGGLPHVSDSTWWRAIREARTAAILHGEPARTHLSAASATAAVPVGPRTLGTDRHPGRDVGRRWSIPWLWWRHTGL